MKKLLSVILLITMLCIISTSAFAFGDNGIMQKAKIKVAVNAEYKPFEYYDENGKLTGFDIDLMNYIGERIGFDIEFVNMEFDALIPAVVNGDVLCAISAITVTNERDSIIDYSREYLKTCSVTFENGQKSTRYGEEYAIVFREGLAGSPYKDLTEPTGDETLYILIDEALRDLSNDRTVMKLIEKYELNKPLDENSVNVEYSAIMGDGDPAAKIVDGPPKTSATSIPASEWAWADIDKAKALNIISGNYDFPGAITREEFCELIYNYCEKVARVLWIYEESAPFKDTDNSKIYMLSGAGIINGKSETEFAPEDFLTREEAATILFRLIDNIYPDWAANLLYYEFDDSAEISDWAMNSVQWICNMGIMNGTGNNKFSPKDYYSTEQAVVTLVRIYANFSDEKNVIGSADGPTDIVVTDEPISKITEDMLFADKLNAQMPKDRNYMFSPMSIKMALALAANGASGNTKAEILNALGISSLDDFNSLSKDLIARYSQTDILNLNIADSIWINKDKTSQDFSDSYKKTATEYYDAEVKSVNKSNAVNEVNSWVNDKTNGKIPQIIENPDDFWAMLINAIYFKGAWQDEFYEGATAPDTFTNADGTMITTDFMNTTDWLLYAETKSAKILGLPYKNRVDKISETGEYLGTERYDDLDVSMYLIMTDSDINVDEELSAAKRDNLFNRTYIKMAMPKFKIEYSASLNDMLVNMGIVTAFDTQNADFKNMFDSGNMWFTNVLHKTHIAVDEKGTEAAAVTAIAMAGSALPPEPIELKFNKPFYFAIRDNTSGETLFMGRYAFAE